MPKVKETVEETVNPVEPTIPEVEVQKTEELSPNSTPPIEFRRNEYGLLSHVNYVFNEDGTVNWRKMIKPEFLAVNKEAFERRNQIPPTSIEGLEDKDLIMLLGGIKELAKIRGYNLVSHFPISVSDHYVAVRTMISWIP